MNQLSMKSLLFFIILSLIPLYNYGGPVLIVTDSDGLLPLKKGLMISKKAPELFLNEAMVSKNFIAYPDEIPNLGCGSHWIRFAIRNKTQQPLLLLKINNSLIDEIDFFIVREKGIIEEQSTGGIYPIADRKYKHQKFILELKLDYNEEAICYLHVKNREEVLLPMFIGTSHEMAYSIDHEDIFFCIYLGIFLSMILYNVFIYFSIKDKVYLWYLGYMMLLAISQFSVYGYIFRFVLPASPDVAYWTFVVSSALVGALAARFIQSFLELKRYSPWLNSIVSVIGCMYLLSLIISVFGFNDLRNVLWDVTGGIGCIVFFVAIFAGIKKRQRQAKFLGISWSVFFLGYMLFVLRNEGILPYNTFTTYCVTAGSAIEAILLSFALADRINILRKENEEKKNEIINYLRINEECLRTSKQLAINAERLKREIVVTEFESLKNQINPHFLFNSLNVLTDLVYEAQEEAVRFVTELANIYRYILDCNQKEVTFLSAELKFIHSYIFLLKMRFEENLDVEVNIPNQSEEMIPPITLQLLIENAIKHNVVSINNPLTIRIYKEKDFLIVRNNIQLRRDQHCAVGIGLKNIISRYLFLTDRKVEINNDGRYFVVKIPILTL